MKVSLENLPPELKKVVIKKIRWCLEEVQGGIEGMSITCPYDSSHFMIYRWSRYFGIELVHCHGCGYRYVPIKQDGVVKLVNLPEKKKQLIVRRKK